MNNENKIKKEFPELYEAIIAHSIVYDYGVGEGHIMEDKALPLGWLVEYLKIIRQETIKRVMEVRPEINNQKEIDWKCPNCGRYGEEGEYCPSDRRKLVKEEREYPDEQDEAHNQALQEWTDNINKLTIKEE